MKRIKRIEALTKILESNGKIFSCTFLKKDNTIRDITCRLGVKKHLVGGKNTTSHLPQYITVYEMNQDDKRSYRNINIDTLLTLTIDKENFLIKEVDQNKKIG